MNDGDLQLKGKQGVPSKTHCLTIVKPLLQSMNPARAGTILKVDAPVILSCHKWKDCNLFQEWQVIQQGPLTQTTLDGKGPPSPAAGMAPLTWSLQFQDAQDIGKNAPAAFLAHSLERHGEQKGQAKSPSKTQHPPVSVSPSTNWSAPKSALLLN